MKTLLLAAILAAPAAAEPKPDWVDGTSLEYPRERYIVGVGMADERATAEERARGEIARIFSQVVTVNTLVSESETNKGASGKSDSSFSQSIAQSVQSVSRKLLEGVELVHAWRDPATSRSYALAILDRAKAGSAVNEKLDDLDKQAAEWKEQMESASERLPRVKAAMKLTALFKAREELNAELRVIDSGGKGRPNPLNEAALRPQAAKALSALEIFIDLSGSRADEIETGIVKGLNSTGLQARSGSPGDGADIIVEGKVDTKPQGGGDGRWKWARSTVTVSLKDGRTQKTFLRFDASERQAASDQTEAARRSLAKLGKKVSASVGQAIADYFENQ